MIAHPPCTFLANSGAKHLDVGCRRKNGAAGDRWANLGHAAALFFSLLSAPIPRITVENPIVLGHSGAQNASWLTWACGGPSMPLGGERPLFGLRTIGAAPRPVSTAKMFRPHFELPSCGAPSHLVFPVLGTARGARTKRQAGDGLH